MKYIKLFEDFNPSVIPQTEPQFTIWMMKNAPKAVLNPQEWFEEELAKPEPNWVFMISIMKELDLANRLSIPEGVKNILEKTQGKEEVDSLSLLHWSIMKDNVELAKGLIEAGANLNVQEISKQTPLHWAALRGHTQIGKILIEAGAALDAQDRWKRTPLHWATITGHIEIAKAFIEAGAALDTQDEDGKTPWNYAILKIREALPELNPNGDSL
jgi:hypothetical protein